MTTKPYAYFLIGLSFFWASITLTNLFCQSFLSLSLCFFLHSLFTSRQAVIYFAALLYCIEYNLWHGSCLPPIIAMTIIALFAHFLKQTIQIPALIIRIFLLGIYLKIEQYIAFLLHGTPVPGSALYFKTFLLSAGFLVFLALFMPDITKNDRIR